MPTYRLSIFCPLVSICTLVSSRRRQRGLCELGHMSGKHGSMLHMETRNLRTVLNGNSIPSRLTDCQRSLIHQKKRKASTRVKCPERKRIRDMHDAFSASLPSHCTGNNLFLFFASECGRSNDWNLMSSFEYLRRVRSADLLTVHRPLDVHSRDRDCSAYSFRAGGTSWRLAL